MTSRATRRRAEPVTIVAAGAVTPLGADLDGFWSGLVTGTDGISMIERFPVDDLRVGRGGEDHANPFAARQPVTRPPGPAVDQGSTIAEQALGVGPRDAGHGGHRDVGATGGSGAFQDLVPAHVRRCGRQRADRG